MKFRGRVFIGIRLTESFRLYFWHCSSATHTSRQHTHKHRRNLRFS